MTPRKSDRVVRKVLADGTVKEYRYAGAPAAKPTPVPQAAPKTPRFTAGTLADLLHAYEMSSAYRDLSDATKVNRQIYLRPLTKYHATPAEEIERGMLMEIADAIQLKRGPAAANGFLNATATVYNWAIKRGKFKLASPLFQVERYKEKHLPAFSREQCDQAEELLEEPLRRALVLGRYTGQRKGDLIRLTWANYDGTMLKFEQQKHKHNEEPVKMALLVHPDLKAELDAWKAEAEAAIEDAKVVSLADKRDIASRTILTDFRGLAWRPAGLSQMMKIRLEKVGLRVKGQRGVNIHGLRKMAAAVLAEEGASVKEIQGVTGHKTLAMIQLYTESADRERLGKQAIMRLPRRS